MQDACPNFRDVGATINLFAGTPLLRERSLYRGGKIDFVDDAATIGAPGLIVNLRRGVDPDLGVPSVQLAADDRLENYQTDDRGVQRWLQRVVETIAHHPTSGPVMVHCAAGRDRTGVVVAAILKILDVDEELIVADYLMTDGVVDDARIRTALRGLEGLRDLWRRLRPALAAKFGVVG